jgi:LytS/YehU family sensor histidine kinase
MLLLPLVENAMKHGPLARHKGAVAFSVMASGDEVVLEISNPGAYAGPREGGNGLPIVEKRLALAYGRTARLTIERDGDRTRASLRLPRLPPSPASLPPRSGSGDVSP